MGVIVAFILYAIISMFCGGFFVAGMRSQKLKPIIETKLNAGAVNTIQKQFRADCQAIQKKIYIYINILKIRALLMQMNGMKQN